MKLVKGGLGSSRSLRISVVLLIYFLSVPKTFSHNTDCERNSVTDNSQSTIYLVNGIGSTESEARAKALQFLQMKLQNVFSKTPSPKRITEIKNSSVLWSPEAFFAGIAMGTKTLSCGKIAVTISSEKKELEDRYISEMSRQEQILKSEFDILYRRVITIRSVLDEGAGILIHQKASKKKSYEMLMATFELYFLKDQADHLKKMIATHTNDGWRFSPEVQTFARIVEDRAMTTKQMLTNL